jgi:hypothetical protein
MLVNICGFYKAYPSSLYQHILIMRILSLTISLNCPKSQQCQNQCYQDYFWYSHILAEKFMQCHQSSFARAVYMSEHMIKHIIQCLEHHFSFHFLALKVEMRKYEKIV